MRKRFVSQNSWLCSVLLAAGMGSTALAQEHGPAGAPQYLIGDYWLFGLEVPPVNYEWVRDGNDALLVDTNSGDILQVEYGVFS
jgi:hypothetical protein